MVVEDYLYRSEWVELVQLCTILVSLFKSECTGFGFVFKNENGLLNVGIKVFVAPQAFVVDSFGVKIMMN